LNEFLFYKSQQRFSQDVDVGLDFNYDGSFQPAGDGVGFVRERVAEMRDLLTAVQAGEAGLEQLDGHIETLTAAMDTAIEQCRGQARKAPDKKAFFEANAQAYEHGAQGLASMRRALGNDDLESLLAGMDAFEAAVAEVDALVVQEESEG
jgi:hypothetical protein